MKFANAIVYTAEGLATAALGQIEDALQALAFEPCGPSQERSVGWVPPRDEGGAMVESVAGQWIAKLMIESKAVPGSAVRRKLDERCAQIETSTGRKPGKKERKELKEDILMEMLPMAFAKRQAVTVWIDPGRRSIVLDTGSQARADLVITDLVRAVDGLAVSLISTKIDPSSAMANWLLSQEPPADFTIDRECELKATDDSKAVVRYAKHPLDIDEVKQHIAGGKRPTRLALTWDDRVSFVLSAGGTLSKITILEGIGDAAPGGERADAFDADVAIVTGELGLLLDALFESLGGRLELVGPTGEPA